MRFFGFLVISLLFAAGPVAGPLSAQGYEKLSLEKDIAPLLQKYCHECHGPKEMKGGFDFSKYKTLEAVQEDRLSWELLIEQMHLEAMPPKKAKAQPTAEERKKLAGWAEYAINAIDCEKLKDPGHGAIRRLNRNEYNHTIRDLIGLDLRPGDRFPGDETGYGFDNIGDILSLPPVLLEKYYDAAEMIMDAAIIPKPVEQRFEAEKVEFRLTGAAAPVPKEGEKAPDASARNPVNDSGRLMTDEGEVFTTINLPEDGFYILRVDAGGVQSGRGSVRMGIFVDGAQATAVSVTAPVEKPRPHQTRLKLTRGRHELAAGFLNAFHDERQPDPTKRDRRLFIDALIVEGPVAVSETPENQKAHERLFAPGGKGDGPDAARKIIQTFASRAYRRPVDGPVLDRILKLYTQSRSEGLSHEGAIRMCLEYVLVSPRFLFRVEQNPSGAKTGQVFPVDDHDLATRLSYFLWVSMPDEALTATAASGKLREPAVLKKEIRRMLADPKSSALGEIFAVQWLGLNGLVDIKPDKETFPTFTPGLRSAMEQEFTLLFNRIVREDRSILELVSADYTYLNEELAKHYGVSGVKGEEMKLAKLSDPRRGGILGMGAFLTLNSNPTRTNVPRRGKWILESVLGTPPPPPPAAVPPLEEDQAKSTPQTLRQILEKHRQDPACHDCHVKIDAMGFALENFDAIGRFRQKDEHGKAIDSIGTLSNGQTLDGMKGLKEAVLARQDQFARNMTEKMLIYALGRGLRHYDFCAVQHVMKTLKEGDYRFSALVEGVATSYPFLHRKKD